MMLACHTLQYSSTTKYKVSGNMIGICSAYIMPATVTNKRFLSWCRLYILHTYIIVILFHTIKILLLPLF